MAKIKFLALVLVFMFLPVFSQESADETVMDYVEEQADGSSMNWTNKVLRVTGNGFGPESVKSLGRRKILAKRAARLDALRNILEAVKGVQVTSNTSVKDMMLVSDQINTGAQGLVKGMRVVKITYTDDGGCEMVAEVNLGQEGNFLLAALNDSVIEVKDNYPKFDWIAMKNELEKTKTELAFTRKTLDSTRKSLNSTRVVLNRKNKELKEIKAEYAILKKDLSRNKEKLIAANQDIIKAEERLKLSNLKKSELTATLDLTQKELKKTRGIINDLSQTLNSHKIDNAAKNSELEMTKKYLSEKKTQLARLDSELIRYRKDYQDAAVDIAKLKGYLQRIKDTQDQTKQKLDSFYVDTSKNVGMDTPGNIDMQTSKNVDENYTGLLIDARSLGLKPVLAPAILNEQKEKIYGVGVIPKTLKGGAIVDYLSGSVDKVKKYKKVGPDPLLVKGIKAVNQSDIMISNADTKKVASIVDLLEEQKVAVLL
ncbi:MAG: LPP20 family lipoprotein [Candidatus Aminicenantes bacterium]|jgi:hypothetical protein